MTLAYSEHVTAERRNSAPAVEHDSRFFHNLQRFGTVQDLVTDQIFQVTNLSLANQTALLFDKETGQKLQVDTDTLQENFRSSGFKMPESIARSTNQSACRVLN